jgi:hypothetical protein
MTGSRRAAATALLVATLVGGCAQPPRPATTAPPPATAPPLVGGDRLVHGYRFPDGERLAPPTGRPRLGWRQAFYVSQRDIGTRELDGLRVDLLMGPFVNPRAPVRVTLADYRHRQAGLVGPLLAWVVVYRNDQAVRYGPTPAEVRGGRDRMLWRWPRCPVYAVVDAISGRYLEEFAACRPPYRG